MLPQILNSKRSKGGLMKFSSGQICKCIASELALFVSVLNVHYSRLTNVVHYINWPKKCSSYYFYSPEQLSSSFCRVEENLAFPVSGFRSLLFPLFFPTVRTKSM